MGGYHNYSNGGSEIKGASSESRTAGKVAEVNRDVNEIRSEILSLRIMVQAMMEILAERGVDPEAVNARIEEIIARPETFTPHKKLSKPCPKCGRLIQDNGSLPLVGTCLYCGEVVKFAPKFVIGSPEPEQPQSDQSDQFDQFDPFAQDEQGF